MKLTQNEINTLYWHLHGFIRAHQPDHPREQNHYNKFYRVDKLTAICERLKKKQRNEKDGLLEFHKRGDAVDVAEEATPDKDK